MIVADTGAILALIDKADKHHETLSAIYDVAPHEWILPWAILPEVDYLVATRIGARAEEAFLSDLSEGAFQVEWGRDPDLERARRICRRHRALQLGLVDAVVIAVAERLHAQAVATLDVRHFGAVTIIGAPRLLPRDA
jgi:predicted nucleic acid-binding protein